MTPTALTAARIVAPAVPEDRQDEYRRLGYVSDMTMSSSVERAARLWGSRPAVAEAGVQMTHRELLEARRACRGLAERGRNSTGRRRMLADAELVGGPSARSGHLARRRGERPDRSVLPGA